MTSISLVLWHFSLDEDTDKPQNSKSTSNIFPGFQLRLHGINTTDGKSQSLSALSILHKRSVQVRDSQGNVCVCTLIGPLNRGEALKAGFSSDLLAEFQQGFPVDLWLTLLQKHIEARFANTSSTENVISLVCWRISFKSILSPSLFRDFGVILYGVRTDTGDQWESSPIIDVVMDNRGLHTVLRTETRTYRLIGEINRSASLQSGIPIELVDSFTHGFPDNWHQIINDCVDYLKRVFVKNVLDNLEEDEEEVPDISGSSNENGPIVEVADETILTSTPVQSGSNFHPNSTVLLHTAEISQSADSEKAETPTQKSKTKTVGRKVAKVKPMGEAQPQQVKVSSSGRVLKPRMETWRGERLVYDIDGNLVNAHCATTKHVSETESPRLLSIASFLNADRVELSKQTTAKPFVPELGRKKEPAKRKRDDRDASVDSYTAKLDAIADENEKGDRSEEQKMKNAREKEQQIEPKSDGGEKIKSRLRGASNLAKKDGEMIEPMKKIAKQNDKMKEKMDDKRKNEEASGNGRKGTVKSQKMETKKAVGETVKTGPKSRKCTAEIPKKKKETTIPEKRSKNPNQRGEEPKKGKRNESSENVGQQKEMRIGKGRQEQHQQRGGNRAEAKKKTRTKK